MFWLRLHDNEYDLITNIENKFNVNVPLVSVIYDDFNTWEIYKLAKTFSKLWNDRVYHISINPFWFSLKQLIEDENHMWWEKKYRKLFRLIKKYNVKVIFRSLHEMNWWWYSRASDPVRFPVFWKMMRNWSREEWLDKSNILFDFSINSQDLPVIEWATPSQHTPVITCNQQKKIDTWCYTFEDYYPWDEYVDLIWITIYNWWTWARKEYWARWRDPMTVINEPWYWTFDRMKKMWKPIFIDESWTTSINIKWPFDELKLIDIYKENHYRDDWKTATWTLVKDEWIKKLEHIYSDSQVVWGAYFNADVTNWLNDRRQIWELDWTAIDPVRNFAYPEMIKLLNDNRILKFPTFYFDFGDKQYKSRETWINESKMIEIHDYISRFMFYNEWNIITANNYEWKYKSAKYQYYLEKNLERNYVLCRLIKEKFDDIICKDSKNSNDLFYNQKYSAMKLIIDKVLSSDIILSNWWVRKYIEKYKKSYTNKFISKETTLYENKVYKEVIDFLNNYELRFLDLR